MNDRYLYRAKRTDNGEWVEGYHVFIDEFIDDVHYIYTGSLYNGGSYVVAERFEVDPATICQCTGLKDNNGKLIWENDIVRGWFDDEWIIGYIYYGSNAHFFIQRKGLYGIQLDNSQDWIDIIGNSFDNPELVEVGE